MRSSFKHLLSFVIAAQMMCAVAFGDILIDMDPSTPAIFETSITVPSGTTVNPRAIYLPPVTGPLTWDAVALDMNYSFGVDTVATVTPALAAPFFTKAPGLFPPLLPPSAVGTLFDYNLAPPTLAGATLAATTDPGSGNAPVGPGVVGAAANIGGAGYTDASGTFFGGLTSPAVVPLDLMGWDFTVTGAVGSTAHFFPSGIVSVVPIFGSAATGGAPFGNTATLSAVPDTFVVPGTASGLYEVTISVPEPSAFLFVGLTGVVIGVIRRRSRSQ